MGKAQNQKRGQIRQARLDIVGELYKKAYSIRQIRSEVMRRLSLSSYSTQTVHRDIQDLLKEWRDSRIDDVDLNLQLELERIDNNVRELYEQWERSKTDYTRTSNKKKGAPVTEKADKKDSNSQSVTTIKTYQTERKEEEMRCLGDVSYINAIREELKERRKLLGLYAPEKREHSGNMGFATFLIESGIIDEPED
jgi:Trp operon repressor